MRMISICIAVLLAAAKVFGACAGHEIASGFNNNVYVEYSATYHYAGHTQYTVTENSDICRIDVSIVGKNGDPSAFNYSASIWSMDGTSLDTRLAQSNTINISANGVKTFTFSTPYTLSPGIDYAITIDHDGDVSETNYVSVSGSNDYWIPGNFAAWATDKTSSASVADDALTMKLYFTQQRGELYMGVLSGDSVTSDYGGNNSVASYLMPNLLISSFLSCIAAPANTIAQQDTQWGTDVYKVDYDWIIVMVGLNDLDPAESAANGVGTLSDICRRNQYRQFCCDVDFGDYDTVQSEAHHALWRGRWRYSVSKVVGYE